MSEMDMQAAIIIPTRHESGYFLTVLLWRILPGSEWRRLEMWFSRS